MGLLNVRNTPQQNMGPSPAQILLGRRTNTQVPTFSKKLKAQYDANDYKNDAKSNASENVKSRDLTKLSAGDNVRMQPIQSGQNEWREATVDKALSNRSYIVKTPDGRSYRRNRRQLRAKPPSTHHTPDPTLQHLIPHVTTPTVADDPQPVTSPVNESPPCQSYHRSSRVRKSVERLISTM